MQHQFTGEEKRSDLGCGETGIWFIFLVWGIGSLLPWNAISTTFDYFEEEVSFISIFTHVYFPF